MKYLVIDVGGSSTKYGITDDSLVIRSRGSKVLGMHGPKEIYYRTIREIYDSVTEEVDGVCISMPGKINFRTGFCQGSSMLNEGNLHIADDLTALLGKPVTIINDGFAAGFAELGYGNMKGIDNGAIMVLGTGIGGCIVINGQFYGGNHLQAGNLSFLQSDVHDQENWENVFASLNGINGLKKAIEKTSGLSDIDGIRAFELIREGNREVEKGLELFCDRLAFQIYNLQIILDLDRILIGGGISREPLFIEYVRKAVERKWERSRVKPEMPEVMTCCYCNDANLLGALYNWKQIHG